MSDIKVACVTGSGKRRIGWHVVAALAQRGYRLAVHYRSSAAVAAETVRQLNASGSNAEAFQADLTEESAIQRMFDAIQERWGRLDVLVHCAAVWSPLRLEEVTAADLRASFEANTLSTFLCCQNAGLRMVAQPEGGCLVTVGDWAERSPP
jgi:pteridine reductase